MNTFEREITFISKVFDSNTNQWVDGEVTKTAIFKELSRTDKLQHKLHFKIISLLENFEGGTEQVKFDTDAVYDLTVKSINTLLIADQTFTVQDKTEFLNDSQAIMKFGLWILGEKIAPFFQTYNLS